MKHFSGFPAKMQYTPLPNLFFSSLLTQIDDIYELKTTLHFFEILYQKKGYPRFVTYSELLNNVALRSSLGESGESQSEVLRNALNSAANRGTFIQLTMDKDGIVEDLFFLNNDQNREAIARIQSGDIVLSGLKTVDKHIPDIEQPDIFTVYEQNVGMLTPMIAEELSEAEKQYSEDWIRDAIREAVLHNKRNIKYILKILERWLAEGRVDGAYSGDSKKKTDPDKYVKGKFGHMVRR